MWSKSILYQKCISICLDHLDKFTFWILWRDIFTISTWRPKCVTENCILNWAKYGKEICSSLSGFQTTNKTTLPVFLVNSPPNPEQLRMSCLFLMLSPTDPPCVFRWLSWTRFYLHVICWGFHWCPLCGLQRTPPGPVKWVCLINSALHSLQLVWNSPRFKKITAVKSNSKHF